MLEPADPLSLCVSTGVRQLYSILWEQTKHLIPRAKLQVWENPESDGMKSEAKELRKLNEVLETSALIVLCDYSLY